MTKGKKRYRFCSFLLAFCLAIPSALPGIEANAAESSSDCLISDEIEIGIDDRAKVPMNLYAGALYETGVELTAGTHTYTVYRNGKEAEKGAIEAKEAGICYVRYMPFQTTKILNSAEDKNFFKFPATMVGTLSNLNSLTAGSAGTQSLSADESGTEGLEPEEESLNDRGPVEDGAETEGALPEGEAQPEDAAQEEEGQEGNAGAKGAAPDAGDAVPGTGDEATDAGDAIPGTGDAVPDTEEIVPGTGDAAPETEGTVAKTGEEVPDTENIVPETGDAVSEEEVSDTENAAPNEEASENDAGVEDDTLDALEEKSVQLLDNTAPAGYVFSDWAPTDDTANLDYVGGGIYSRTFPIQNPSGQDVDFLYKVAFQKTWDVPSIGLGGAYGDNIPATIHANATSFTVTADEFHLTCELTDSTQTFDVYQSDNGGSQKKYAKGELWVRLVGTMTGWNEDPDQEFTKISPSLYALTTTVEKGDHSYKCKFPGDTWFQNENDHSLNLANDRVVTFVYDAANQKLYDTVNDGNVLNNLLDFKEPLDMGTLDQHAYTGNDLGAVYTKDKTVFKVWAPTASEVVLNLYREGKKDAGSPYETKTMTFDSGSGVWSVEVGGDLKGVYYTYSVTVEDQTNETVDIYAKAAGLNGDRGMVVDLDSTDPAGFENDAHVTQKALTDAFIWEVHVQDFSSSSTSGISSANRGKYLAFTETGTTVNGEGQISTGVDYLKQLGVNYIHLLPCQDMENDETDNLFNWGYGPKNYNVTEGKYSSDPANATARITEFKQMVQSLHRADIGVVMDVVYNHTYKTKDSWFNLTVPNYYYRQDEYGNFLNGSACGNETASERAMFRKYMVDSILYWATEYHVDGFRFDLMGLHDVETMNAIRRALNDAGLSDVILYGEPWDAGNNGMTGNVLPANKENVQYLSDGIAVFNDDIRDAVKGYVFNDADKGFVQGGNVDTPSGEEYKNRTYSDNDLMAAIQANANIATAANAAWTKTAWAVKPSHSIAYASAHDNLSLWDKLVASTIPSPQESDYRNASPELIRMNKLAAAAIMTSQGAVFFQAGEEFARTKLGDGDSYESPIEINQLDWTNLKKFSELNEYYKGLIRLRKAFAPFRDSTNGTIGAMSFANDNIQNLVAYTIQNPNPQDNMWDTVAVLLNSTGGDQQVELSVANGTVPESWAVVVNQTGAGVKSLGTLTGKVITVPAGTAMVLVDQTSYARVESNANPEEQVENNTKPVLAEKITGKNKVIRVAKGKTAKVAVNFTPKNTTDKTLTYSTANKKIATVNKNGKISGKKRGVTSVTVKTSNGKKIKIPVRVGYKITYKLDGGKNSAKNFSSYYKEKVKLYSPTKKGYTFAGWYTDKAKTKKITSIPKKAAKNYTLYAKWKKVKVSAATLKSASSKKAGRISVKVSKVSGAKDYQVQYATDSKFTKNRKKAAFTGTSKTIKGLKPGTYYVRVRAYKLDSAKNKVYSKYSKSKKIVVK